MRRRRKRRNPLTRSEARDLLSFSRRAGRAGRQYRRKGDAVMAAWSAGLATGYARAVGYGANRRTVRVGRGVYSLITNGRRSRRARRR